MRKKSRRKVAVNPKKFSTYALASAAAFVGAETADAEITVVTVNVPVNDTDVDSSGVGYQIFFGDASSFHLDFYHYLNSEPPRFGFATGGGQVFPYDSVTNPTPGVSVAGFSDTGSYYLSNVAAGAAISALTNWIPGSTFGSFAYGSGYLNSQVQSRGIGVLAVRWDNDGGGPNDLSYGWVRISVEGVAGNGLGIIDYGFAEPGQALKVNQRVPEPGSLACLALGAVGLISWRRRRKAA